MRPYRYSSLVIGVFFALDSDLRPETCIRGGVGLVHKGPGCADVGNLSSKVRGLFEFTLFFQGWDIAGLYRIYKTFDNLCTLLQSVASRLALYHHEAVLRASRLAPQYHDQHHCWS